MRTLGRWLRMLLWLAFGLSIGVGSAFFLTLFGQFSWSVAALAVSFGAMLGYVPRLRDEWLRLSLAALYFSVFAFLWIKSGDNGFLGETATKLKRLMLLGLPALAACFAGFTLVRWRQISWKGTDLIPWLGLAFVGGWAIAYLSGSKGGPDPMHELFMRWFAMGSDQATSLVLAVRKSIHFTFYGLMGLAMYKMAAVEAKGKLQPWLAAMGFVLAHAAFDELRQSASSVRTGSAWDVLLDLAGAATFVGLASRQSNVKTTLPA